MNDLEETYAALDQKEEYHQDENTGVTWFYQWRGVWCKSQDSVGEISIILRAVPAESLYFQIVCPPR